MITIRTIAAAGHDQFGNPVSKVEAIDTAPELFAVCIAAAIHRYAALRSQLEEIDADELAREVSRAVALLPEYRDGPWHDLVRRLNVPRKPR